MNERGILFSAPMVRAILYGSKTQTRRVIKPQPVLTASGLARWAGVLNRRGFIVGTVEHESGGKTRYDEVAQFCPYGQPGDHLWVRETWRIGSDGIEYRADDVDFRLLKWRPSIFMPRAASRITLKITDVHVQRIQEISEYGADQEGVADHYYCDEGGGEAGHHCYAREKFQELWNSINKERGFGWDKNPWVWAITFKRVEDR